MRDTYLVLTKDGRLLIDSSLLAFVCGYGNEMIMNLN